MRGRIGHVSLMLFTPVVLVLVWWTASSNSTSPFFPPLEEILVRFRELWLFDHFASDVLVSLWNLGLGYALSVVGGIALGVVFATVPLLRAMFEPVIHLARGVPPVALIPILITLIGFGAEMRVSTIVVAAIFPTMIATIDGIRSLDPGLRDVVTAYRLTRFERFSRVYLPSAGPQIAAGMQVSLQVAFIVMISAEMLGSSQGIGAMTLLAQQSFFAADMWAGILLLGFIGLIANGAFELARTRVLAWYIASKRMERAL